MEQAKNYKKTLIGAITSTFLVVLILITMIRSKDGNGDNVILLVVIMGLTITSSLQWVRFVKQYVDFAIEEKINNNP